jgi:hypothetical protein
LVKRVWGGLLLGQSVDEIFVLFEGMLQASQMTLL